MKLSEMISAMKTSHRIIGCFSTGAFITAGLRHSLLLALSLALPFDSRAADAPKVFATPEDATAFLAAAVRAENEDALRSVFGPALAELENPDRTQAASEYATFAAAIEKAHRLVRESDSKYVLEIGADHWPFPVPLVRGDGGWFFDTAAGLDELLNRRIGRNELAVLRVMRAYVNAQREYAQRDRDGDEVLEYAQRLASTPGLKDGLFWAPQLEGEISPLGPLVVYAQSEGYRVSTKEGSVAREPFHGYYYKILARQGKHAPGGKYNYVINGNMIGGFALVAWPADYGNTGVMTFIVNQQGRTYERDLGKTGTKAVGKMKSYDPAENWRPSKD